MKDFEIVINFIKNKRIFLSILIFDALCLLSLFLIGNVFRLLTPEDELINYSSLWYIAFILVIYLLLLIFIYSFFKYIVLHFIGSFYKKQRFYVVDAWKFFLLNIFIFIIYFLIFLIVFLLLLFLTEQRFFNYAILIAGFILILLLYPHLNVLHSWYPLKKEFLFSLKNSIKFFKIKWIKVYFYDLIFVFILLLFYLLSLLVTKIFKKYFLVYQIHFFIMVILTLTISYAIIFFNRIYFYDLVRGHYVHK